MKKDYLEIGKIIGTHGVKGELRFLLWCDDISFLKEFNTLYFNSDGTEKVNIVSLRQHGKVALLSLNGINSIEAAAALRNKILYIKRSDANIEDGGWFIQELIGNTVIDYDNENIIYGTISEVSQTGANDVWHIKKGEKVTLIPAIEQVVKKVDIDGAKVYIRPLRGLFDED